MFMINILGDLHKRVSHGYQFLLKRVLFLLAQLRPSRGIKSRRSMTAARTSSIFVRWSLPDADGPQVAIILSSLSTSSKSP